MNLSDDHAQSKAVMIWNRQKPTLYFLGGSKCAESGELNESLKSSQFVFKLPEKQRSEGRYHGVDSRRLRERL